MFAGQSDTRSRNISTVYNLSSLVLIEQRIPTFASQKGQALDDSIGVSSGHGRLSRATGLDGQDLVSQSRVGPILDKEWRGKKASEVQKHAA